MKNKNKKSLKEIYIEAVENYKNKNLKVAEKLCFKILSIDSNHFDSISLLATISAMSRNFEDAKNFLLKATITLCSLFISFAPGGIGPRGGLLITNGLLLIIIL